MKQESRLQAIAKKIDSLVDTVHLTANLLQYKPYMQSNIANIPKQVFVGLNISQVINEVLEKAIIEQLEIAFQILLNQGHNIIVCSSNKTDNNICKHFVDVFKNKCIQYVGDIEKNPSIMEQLNQSEFVIVMDQETLIYSLVMSKLFVPLFINKDLVNLLELQDLAISKNGFHAGILLGKIDYLKENGTKVKSDFIKIYKENEKILPNDWGEDNPVSVAAKFNPQMIVTNKMTSYKKKFKENIQLLMEQGALQEAKRMLEEYEKIVRDDTSVFSIKGVMAMMEGRMNEAEKILIEGVRVEPYNFDILYDLAYLYDYTELSCKPLAIYYYGRCMEITDDHNIKSHLEKEIDRIRKDIYIFNNNERPLVSIVVLAFNKLEYTKICVESLYKYTNHIEFELITVNNGSCDETEEFFNSLPNRKKINIKNNVGGVSGFNAGLFWAEGKYLVYVGNDLILTKNWLDNMIKCIESDENIGFVAPGANILSNYQAIPVNYTNMEEMHRFAQKHNISDHRKWEERVRVMPLTMIIKKDVFDKTGGLDHRYYLGEFCDDDFSFIVRRMGYKLIYAADTFIHHFGSITGGAAQRNENSLDIGKEMFIDKFDINPWEEASFDNAIIKCINIFKNKSKLRVMGINCFCGGTPLQLRNIFLREGIKNTQIINYNSNSKYKKDLITVSDKVIIDQLNRIEIYDNIGEFDYIILESNFHEVEDIEIFFTKLKKLLSSKYQIVIKIENLNYWKNIYDNFINDTELKKVYINIYILVEKLKKLHLGEINTINVLEEKDNYNNILESININGKGFNNQQINQLLTKYFIISITKD